MEITTTEQNKEKRMKRIEDSRRDLWDNIKHTNIRIIGVSEEEEKKKELKNYVKRLWLKTTEYTFFSNAHGTFSRIDHILGHKSSLGKFNKIDIISIIFFNHNTMTLDIKYRKNNSKKRKHMEAKQYTT